MHDVIIATLTTNPIVGIYSSRSVGASLPSDSRITVGRRAAAQPSTELDLAQNETNSLCCSSLSSVRAGRMLTRNNNDFVRTSAHSIRRTQLMRSVWHLATLAILFSAFFLAASLHVRPTRATLAPEPLIAVRRQRVHAECSLGSLI